MLVCTTRTNGFVFLHLLSALFGAVSMFLGQRCTVPADSPGTRKDIIHLLPNIRRRSESQHPERESHRSVMLQVIAGMNMSVIIRDRLG